MNYQEFKNCSLDYMQHLGDGDNTVMITQVVKNNNTSLDVMTFEGSAENIRPIIYLKPFYEAYRSGTPLSDIFDQMRQVYESGKSMLPPETAFLDTYDSIKDSIVFRLINAAENRELLDEVPHRMFLDLALIFCIVIHTQDQQMATTVIHNEHLAAWDITEKDLLYQAFQNTPSVLPAQLSTLTHVICELTDLTEKKHSVIPEVDYEEPVEDTVPMYVLTNNCRAYGASCILYPGIMQEISRVMEHKDYYVLPSSIHELIIVPCRNDIHADNLKEMVGEVNRSEVSPMDVLSWSVYRYYAKEDRIRVAC